MKDHFVNNCTAGPYWEPKCKLCKNKTTWSDLVRHHDNCHWPLGISCGCAEKERKAFRLYESAFGGTEWRR